MHPAKKSVCERRRCHATDDDTSCAMSSLFPAAIGIPFPGFLESIDTKGNAPFFGTDPNTPVNNRLPASSSTMVLRHKA